MSEESGVWQPNLANMGTTLAQAHFVVLDIETTGAAPTDGNGITEIGAIRISGGNHLARFNELINPGISIPNYITELTGITDAMLFDKPSIKDVIPKFIEFLGDPSETILVAHNSPFDLSFLKSAAVANQILWPKYRVIDTVKFARYVIERFEIANYKLSTLADFVGTQNSPSHRAMKDVESTVEVFHHLIERVAGFDVFTVEDLLNFLKVK
jgi:DNA polymerase III epsilon subunit family exonuclease